MSINCEPKNKDYSGGDVTLRDDMIIGEGLMLAIPLLLLSSSSVSNINDLMDIVRLRYRPTTSGEGTKTMIFELLDKISDGHVAKTANRGYQAKLVNCYFENLIEYLPHHWATEWLQSRSTLDDV